MSVIKLSPAAATMPAAEPHTAKAATEPVQKLGMRVNGKNWHAPKKPFRPTAGQTSYAKRKEREILKQATKAREQEMKEEKEAERNRRVQAIKDRRKAKEEKERYEKMAEKMHKKSVERRKRREKRNKLLKS
ncbi:rRNA-processing protein cgrA [Fonsecaea multimorphosa CBS 102226]|uniref:rRNA-processing protein n=1 Tax=Fonsecaea multimorphosa CBS 102226 TaxID=1442371 RepID=A0A0D2JYX1_9EURO|nr:rRNA-processing protein cgrA [Fonsecaea multimorphosa CBS 102226]KIX98727.1 rRNA-processing protein cgrA [Fonsecaea multimorphosa CBS 102226]OAL32933.1 rRNA-processing protein cgrA [Fonsecaea multimorphosa]